MDDIRINKNKIKTSIINLSFLKFNFSFYSKVFVKYNKQIEFESFLSSQASLVLLLNNEVDNSDILDSINKILNTLKKKDEPEKLNAKDSVPLESEKLGIVSNEFSSINKFNQYKSTERNLSLYNNIRKYDSTNKIINYLISNINSLLLNNKKEKVQPQKKISKNENECEKIKVKGKTLDHKPSEFSRFPKKENKKGPYLRSIDNLSKKDQKKLIQDNISPEYSEEQKETESKRTKEISNFTSELKKINEKLIKSEFKKIKIDKIGFDIVNRSVKFNKNIYDKVNKTIYSAINSDERIRYFSKASKDIVLFNKKFKSNNIIKDLQNVIVDYKENKRTLSKSKKDNKKRTFTSTSNDEQIYKNIRSLERITNYNKSKLINKSNKISSKIINDHFTLFDNSFFYNYYNRFPKMIKNKNVFSVYDYPVLKYSENISKVKKNKLIEFINDLSVQKFTDNVRSSRINLHFLNSEYSKKLTKENKIITNENLVEAKNAREYKYVRNIVYKNEVDIQKKIDECVSKKIENVQKKEGKKNVSTHYNERVIKMVEREKTRANNNRGAEKPISRKDVQEMIDNSKRPINIRRVADLVSERLKQMSNIDQHKSIF